MLALCISINKYLPNDKCIHNDINDLIKSSMQLQISVFLRVGQMQEFRIFVSLCCCY